MDLTRCEGLLISYHVVEHDLHLVVEPADADYEYPGEIAGQVTEVRLRGFDQSAVSTDALEQSLGNLLFIEVLPGGMISIAGDRFPQRMLAYESLSSEERAWTIVDLKDKYRILGQAYERFRSFAGEQSRQRHRLRNAIRQFIADRGARWSARRDFFASRNPEKASVYEEKLDVLEELEKLIEQQQQDAEQSHAPVAQKDARG